MNTNLSIDGEMNDDSVDSSTVHTSPVSKQQRESREREQRGQQSRSQDDENGDKAKFDLQLAIDVKWDSSMYIEVVCSLLVNYPAPEFIKLPVRLKITNLSIHSLAIVAYLDKKVFLSFLCDIDDDENDNSVEENTEGGANENGSNLNQSAPTGSPTETRQDFRKPSITELHHIPSLNRERIDIIKNLKIEGELGNCDQMNQHIDTSNGSILRNIGKIEKFLVTALRTLLIKELGWPSWIELDFNNDDEDSDEDDSEEENDADDGNEDDPEQTLL
ncbi:unnamed protein product [Ambrosiozyma monospora]|uniref:Unnamed protein product n=1 Tax=Ambrosiozyma monospora TaxID=43982 RepID=A0A9W6Z1Q5_AMBMO|nr:unnamed protein product [Ambrosiozyma monospora]